MLSKKWPKSDGVAFFDSNHCSPIGAAKFGSGIERARELTGGQLSQLDYILLEQLDFL